MAKSTKSTKKIIATLKHSGAQRTKLLKLPSMHGEFNTVSFYARRGT